MPARTPSLALIAWYEAAKGVLLLLVAGGLLRLLHGDARELAEALVAQAHLDPSRAPAHLFLELADHATDARLWLLSATALLDAGIRLAIGWGLWYDRLWGYWLGAAAGLIYVPLELVSIAEHATIYRLLVLAANIAIVAYLVRRIRVVTPAP